MICGESMQLRGSVTKNIDWSHQRKIDPQVATNPRPMTYSLGFSFVEIEKKINDDETQRGFSSVFLFLCVPIIRITFLLAVKCDESKRCYVIAEQSFTSHWRR